MHAPDTLAYFCALPGRNFWEWESDDEGGTASIHWPVDRQLIAFRPELENALEAFVLHGLPPLGSVLLVLDALRVNWTPEECLGRLEFAMGTMSGEKEISLRAKTLIEKNVGYLEHMHLLEKRFTEPGPARQRLLRTLFEGCHGLLEPAKSRAILAQFVQTPHVTVFCQRSLGLNGLARLLSDLNTLSKAFQACPPEHLVPRLEFGIDQPPDAAIALPIAKPGGPADLIRALETEGGELAQVASLARRLNAILHVPKAIIQPQGLPVGGVTDITTRGDPSQLLVTELAWDDLTFAARLSQGEALYLRREAPPAEPPQQRILLIDTGIFLWGKPRLFALGAALALLGQRRHTHGKVYVLERQGFESTSLDTVDLVRTHLSRLQPFPNPGHALALLAEGADSPFETDGEIILISHPAAQEALNHLPVWRRLCETSALHTLLVDRHGDIEFSRHQTAGARVLSRVHVDADDLFESSRKASPASPRIVPALTDQAALLPRFYQDNNWPLLHPVPPDPAMVYQVDADRLVGVSSTGCVCLWSRSGEVGKILLPKMPAPTLSSADLSGEQSDKILLSFLDYPSSSIELVTVSKKDRIVLSIHTVDIGGSKITGGVSDFSFACWQSDHLIVHLDDRSDAYSGGHRGQKIASMPHQSGKSWPVFDGERFHASGPSKLNRQSLEKARQLPTRRSQRQLIRRVHSVAFGTTGGLTIMNEGGHTYRLDLHLSGLSWEGRRLPGDIFQKLHPVSHPKWQELELSMREFADGRRVVYDPRGYLHVCGTGEDAEELSFTLVKGHTVAWSSRGRDYGEPNLLDGRTPAPMIELTSLSLKLLRAAEVPASKF